VAELIAALDPDRVRANLARIRDEIAAAAARAGRDPADVELLAATKYVGVEDMAALAEAGIELVGENRAQDLAAKQERWGERFTWDFIGHLQSRKVAAVTGRVRLVHSVASDSVLRRLERHGEGREILVEVNLSGEGSKSGVPAAELDAFLARCPVPVIGLTTMPPPAGDPEASRPYFAGLRALAAERGLARLSMGTTQDFTVAVEEGATIVRIGTRLYAGEGS
jgi:pyridoxal phosphate enzyme (YggS family)